MDKLYATSTEQGYDSPNTTSEDCMNYLHLLRPYVLTGTTEGDRAFLEEVFITPDQLAEVLGIEAGGMRILVGNKGMGKSAIVEWIQKVAKKRELACLLLRPDDLDLGHVPASPDIGALKRHFYETLLRATCQQVGAQLKGLLVGDAATLYHAAQEKGLAPQDLVQKTLALVSAISTPILKVDGVKLAKDLSGSNSPNALIRAVSQQLLKSGAIFFLIIDDTDQVAAPGTPAHLNRVWALILAVRKLAGECTNIRAIITLRTEVWARLTVESEGQRDQTDHVRGLKINLQATDQVITNIVRRRLEAAAAKADKLTGDPYELFFKGNKVMLPSSTDERSWSSFIVKSARERPRDALQLIKNMIDVAAANGNNLLGSDEANLAMKVYSKERVDDLNKEFAPDCALIRDVITTFADQNFVMSFKELNAHLQTIPSTFSLEIRGITMKPQNERDALVILALLHETGFINPRVPDARKDRLFDHILFPARPDFVSMAHWNEMEGATWEVHPAFRSYLMTQQDNKIARSLPAPRAKPFR